MADSTSFLNLTLPGKGEFVDSWNEPMNANFSAIDIWANNINTEIINARFSKATLKEFLEVSHNTDGSLLPAIVATN